MEEDSEPFFVANYWQPDRFGDFVHGISLMLDKEIANILQAVQRHAELRFPLDVGHLWSMARLNPVRGCSSQVPFSRIQFLAF